MSSNQLWFEKYRPKCLKDMFLSNSDKTTITKWINDFKKKKDGYKNCLLLFGPPGIGKTTLANIILNENNFDPIEFNASEFRNQKLIKEHIEEINGNINILDFMCQKKKQIGIIMDEIDGMSSGDRGGLSELISIMFKKNKNKDFNSSPFICITNTIDKKIKSIKDKSCYIKFSSPNNFQLNLLLKKILENENIKLEDESILNNIAKHSQYDFRRLINLAEYIFKSKINFQDDPELVNHKINDLISTFEKKNIDHTPYACTEKILNIYKDIDSIYKLYESDKNLVGLLMYENFSEFIIKNRKDSKKEKMSKITDIYNLYSSADIIDKEIYINQNFSLNSYACVNKCVIPSYIINKMGKYSCNKSVNIKYSSLINKTSLEYLNYKYIDIINKKIVNYSNTDICHFIIDIIVLYIFRINFDDGIKILKYYKINFDDFDKIVKVSFLKNEYSNAIKKKIKIEIS